MCSKTDSVCSSTLIEKIKSYFALELKSSSLQEKVFFGSSSFIMFSLNLSTKNVKLPGSKEVIS